MVLDKPTKLLEIKGSPYCCSIDPAVVDGEQFVIIAFPKGNLKWMKLSNIAVSKALSGFDEFIVFGSTLGVLKKWNLQGNLLKEWDMHSLCISSVDILYQVKEIKKKTTNNLLLNIFKKQEKILEKKTFIISCSFDETIGICEENGKFVRRLKGHNGAVSSLAVLFNYTEHPVIISGSSDETIKIWDPESGECIKTFLGHEGRVYSVAVVYDKDGIAYIVSGSNDATVRVWDIKEEKCIKIYKGHSEGIQSVTVLYGKDGKPYIVSGSWDKTIKIWDFATGECVKTLQGHLGWVQEVKVFYDKNNIPSIVSLGQPTDEHIQEIMLWALDDLK
jgi:WD40 repeat protein